MNKLSSIKYLIIIVIILAIALGATIVVLSIYGNENRENLTNEVKNTTNETLKQNIVQNNQLTNDNTIDNKEPQNNTLKNIEEYFYNYTANAVSNTELAYNMLDTEYREKRFGSIETYKQYVEKNRNRIEDALVMSYGVKNKDGYVQYTLVDSYNNTYIINANIDGYSVIADIYTVDIDTITERYDEGSNKQKVIINIQKIISALNCRDYEYVYGKLKEEFKQTNYPTIQQFETAMNSIIYGSFTVEFNDYTEDEGHYIYEISIVGDTVASTNLNMQIVMELKDQRDFEISFKIKEVN